MNLETKTAAKSVLPRIERSGSVLCSKDALTDDFGWSVQAVLACLAFMCLICEYYVVLFRHGLNKTLFGAKFISEKVL